jgi:hypothetical protein
MIDFVVAHWKPLFLAFAAGAWATYNVGTRHPPTSTWGRRAFRVVEWCAFLTADSVPGALRCPLTPPQTDTGGSPPPTEGPLPMPNLLIEGQTYRAIVDPGHGKWIVNESAIRGKLEPLGFRDVHAWPDRAKLPADWERFTPGDEGDLWYVEATWSRASGPMTQPAEVKDFWPHGGAAPPLALPPTTDGPPDPGGPPRPPGGAPPPPKGRPPKGTAADHSDPPISGSAVEYAIAGGALYYLLRAAGLFAVLLGLGCSASQRREEARLWNSPKTGKFIEESTNACRLLVLAIPELQPVCLADDELARLWAHLEAARASGSSAMITISRRDGSETPIGIDPEDVARHAAVVRIALGIHPAPPCSSAKLISSPRSTRRRETTIAILWRPR